MRSLSSARKPSCLEMEIVEDEIMVAVGSMEALCTCVKYFRVLFLVRWKTTEECVIKFKSVKSYARYCLENKL